MTNGQFGMIGLGTMGRNFLLNVAEHGFSCVGYDLDESKRQLLMNEGAGMPIDAGASVTEFLNKLASPKNIMMLVPAGPIVDSVISDLLPHLREGDLSRITGPKAGSARLCSRPLPMRTTIRR